MAPASDVQLARLLVNAKVDAFEQVATFNAHECTSFAGGFGGHSRPVCKSWFGEGLDGEDLAFGRRAETRLAT
jgi:hypothetical protein